MFMSPRARITTLGFVWFVSLPTTLLADTVAADSLAVRLEKGKFLEESKGDLAAAMEIYRKILNEAKKHRGVAAEATYRLAECHLKSGEASAAASLLNDIVDDFPDQKEFVRRARKKLATLSQDEKLPPLGEVIERIVNDDGVGKGFAIDFDRGEVLTRQVKGGTEVERLRALTAQGVDAIGETKPSGPGLYGIDFIGLPLATPRFAGATLASIQKDLEGAKPGRPVVLSALGELPRSYSFQTREGSVGVLQITDLVDKTKPRHLKIRYRLLKHGEKVLGRRTVSKADRLRAEELAASGWRLWQKRKLAAAEAAFKESVDLNPDAANAWNGLGWSQLNQGKREHAAEAFQRCIELEPKHAPALNGLGWLAKGRGDADAAIEFWEKAISAEPGATAALNGLATTHAERGEYAKAARYYEQWLKHEPGSADAKRGLVDAKRRGKKS